MHLADSFLHFKADFYLLISSKLHDGDADLFLLISAGEILNWLNSPHFLIFSLQPIENASNMEGSNLQDILAGVLSLKNEVCLAEQTILYAFLSASALPRVFEFFNCIADERDESDPLAEELIMED